jgi:multiple sugar transport system substrate-binding protein
MSDWRGFLSHLKQGRSGLIFLAALWLSLGVPGCISSPPNSQTSSSSQPTQTASSTPKRFDGITVNFLSQTENMTATIK